MSELGQERSERLRQYDDLRDDLTRDFERMEILLNQNRGDAKPPIKSSISNRKSSDKKDLPTILQQAKQVKIKQNSAIEAERQRQDEIFQKKLAEKRKNRK